MADQTADAQLNVRLRRADLDRIKALQQRLEVKYGPAVRITTQTVILEALTALEASLSRQEKAQEKRAAK